MKRNELLNNAIKALEALNDYAQHDQDFSTDLYTCINHADNEHDTELSEIIKLMKGLR